MDGTDAGRAVKAGRALRGLLQDVAAKELGMTVDRLSGIETGRITDPKASEILALRDTLGVDPSVWGITTEPAGAES
jgi:transcriptional regulator with XRE-family HTH domain